MTRFPAALAFLAATMTAALAGELHEPAKGSAERKAILDAIRPAIEAQMRAPVEFRINIMLSDGEWASRKDQWLPSKADGDFIQSLMQPCWEPGKFASWIAAPKVGIDNKPGEFEYVKIHRA